jgi:acyl-CoA synthetase (AMP-forming)/AMP-acid ligase II
LGSLFSDKLASPSGASWPLFLAVSQFFPSSALFALHSAVSAISHGQGVQFCTTFAHHIRISSSTTSLRNSWAYRGETVIAYVALKNGFEGKVTPGELIEFCKQRLANYKYPRHIEIMEELPKTPTGKFLRRELRDKTHQ